jgi:hypothetical protein
MSESSKARDAVVSQFGTQSLSVSQPFLSKRAQTIVQTCKPFDGLSRESVRKLSLVLQNENPMSYKSLKLLLEYALVDVHGRFISEFEGKVSRYVNQKASTIEQTDERLSEIVDKLSINRDRIVSAVDSGMGASGVLAETERKMKIVNRCLELFVPDTDSDSRSKDLRSVLEVFERVEKKRSNCKTLLKCVPNSKLAIECLNRSIVVLDSLYEDLFFALMNRAEDDMRMLARSLVFLQERPNLLHDALSHMMSSRCDTLSSEFLRVLTRDEDGLELSSFDAVKFGSDMLQWMYDSVIQEKDRLDTLTSDIRDMTWSTAPALPRLDYLDMAVSGVLEMIDSRLSNSVKSSFNVLELFKLSKIISYYLSKLKQSCGASTQSILRGMHHTAWSSFQFQWERRISNHRSTVLYQPGGPPQVINETAFMLDSILEIESSSPEESDDVFSVVSSGIDPLIQLCFQSTGTKIESAVFILNCLHVLQVPLLKYQHITADTLRNISALIEDQVSSLIAETTHAVLARTGLGTKLEAIRQLGSGKPLESNDPELHPIALSSSVKNFYSLLFTQGIAAISHVDSLISKNLRSKARECIALSLADAYAELYRAVSYLGVTSHTPQQVRALLDI